MIFEIAEDEFLNSEKVKIIDGIAGAGKSSIIHSFFEKRGIKYLRVTSTNVLRRSAEERYCMKCDTIAGALFTTENGKFFNSEKDPEHKVVVIDEILQTNGKVIDWIRSHRGEYNIIVTTDTHQMLAQDSGKAFLEDFLEYCKTDDVIYRCVKETKRAKTEETKKLYDTLYNINGEKTDAFRKLKNILPQVEESSFSYNEGDVFICHTKEIENELYKRWNLSADYSLPLIPKGAIARKNPSDLTKYPIFSQLEAEKLKKACPSYLQIANIATPTRYQGSEVTNKQRLFFVLEKESVVTNRELYTVLTRCYDYKSLYIVYVNIEKKEMIKQFRGLPVHRVEYLNITTDDPEKYIPDPEHPVELYERVLRWHECPEDVIYNIEGIVINGEYHKNYVEDPDREKPPRRLFTARSLIEKEPCFDYSFMDDVYRILDKNNIERITYPSMNNKNRIAEKYNYELDLFSAYPTILKFGRLPIDGKIYTEYDKTKMNFFYYTGKETTAPCIVTDEIADLAREDEKIYLFSTNYRKGSKMGDTLYELAHSSVEDKAKVKTMHYGVWQKPYLEKINQISYNDYKAGVPGWCYIAEQDQNHELIMVAIMSQLLYIMMNMLMITEGFIRVDAIFFNDGLDKKKDELKGLMEKKFGGYDFRIKTRGDDTIIFKTYDDLKTKKEIRREKERKRIREKRAKEKENNV